MEPYPEAELQISGNPQKSAGKISRYINNKRSTTIAPVLTKTEVQTEFDNSKELKTHEFALRFKSFKDQMNTGKFTPITGYQGYIPKIQGENIFGVGFP